MGVFFTKKYILQPEEKLFNFKKWRLFLSFLKSLNNKLSEMDLTSKIFIRFFCNKVGTDEFGNSYFEAKKSRNNHKRRYVIYNGLAEPSKVPPDWHLWLHYVANSIPNDSSSHQYSWQKIHLPNLTGTKFAHFPSGSAQAGGKRTKVSSDYQAWNPN